MAYIEVIIIGVEKTNEKRQIKYLSQGYHTVIFIFFYLSGLALKGIHLLSLSLSLSTSVSLSHYTEWHAVHHPDTNLLENLEGGEIIKDMGFRDCCFYQVNVAHVFGVKVSCHAFSRDH